MSTRPRRRNLTSPSKIKARILGSRFKVQYRPPASNLTTPAKDLPGDIASEQGVNTSTVDIPLMENPLTTTGVSQEWLESLAQLRNQSSREERPPSHSLHHDSETRSYHTNESLFDESYHLPEDQEVEFRNLHKEFAATTRPEPPITPVKNN